MSTHRRANLSCERKDVFALAYCRYIPRLLQTRGHSLLCTFVSPLIPLHPRMRPHHCTDTLSPNSCQLLQSICHRSQSTSGHGNPTHPWRSHFSHFPISKARGGSTAHSRSHHTS